VRLRIISIKAPGAEAIISFFRTAIQGRVLRGQLRRRSEREGVPNEFWPHHGSLSRELREESKLPSKWERAASAICTTTLELGIDIAAFGAWAQIGPPPSVASLRQRLGRSGRRAGESAILRCFQRRTRINAESGIF